MILVLPVVVAVCVSLLQGGSLSHLRMLPIRGTWAIVSSFVIQAAMYVVGDSYPAFVRQTGAGIYIPAMVLVMYGVLRNWRLGAAARLVLLGLSLNLAVIAANGGRMPVDTGLLRATEGAAQVRALELSEPAYYNREAVTAGSRLTFLSDEIEVPFPLGHGYVCSIGDIVLAVGAGLLSFKATRRPWPQNQAESPAPSAQVVLRLPA